MGQGSAGGEKRALRPPPRRVRCTCSQPGLDLQPTPSSPPSRGAGTATRSFNANGAPKVVNKRLEQIRASTLEHPRPESLSPKPIRLTAPRQLRAPFALRRRCEIRDNRKPAQRGCLHWHKPFISTPRRVLFMRPLPVLQSNYQRVFLTHGALTNIEDQGHHSAKGVAPCDADDQHHQRSSLRDDKKPLMSPDCASAWFLRKRGRFRVPPIPRPV
jgi:hypothetical protein